MTRLEALAQTQKRFTNLLDRGVIPNTSIIEIITYYEYVLDTNPVEVKHQSGIESNFIEEELNEADYWDGDESQHYQ
jgi:hypothetical protein